METHLPAACQRGEGDFKKYYLDNAHRFYLSFYDTSIQ